jgi:hypothetical protein
MISGSGDCFGKYKSKYIRPKHEKNEYYFLVYKSSTHTGFESVKNSAMNISDG